MKRNLLVGRKHSKVFNSKKDLKRGPIIIRTRMVQFPGLFAALLIMSICSLVSLSANSVISIATAEPSIQQQVQSNSLSVYQGDFKDEGLSKESLVDSIKDNYLSSSGESSGVRLAPFEFTTTNNEGPIVWNRIPSQQQSGANEHENADWWTKLAFPKQQARYPIKSESNHTVSQLNRNYDKSTKRIDPQNSRPNVDDGFVELTKPHVYRVQPLSQNPILKVWNQLFALRAKHRLLVTNSIRQLDQLDHKLIDTYRLCFKRNMPLYAGVLYRTRDFVAKMAREVKQERLVLELLDRKAQNALRQLMTNQTLLREYNKLQSSQEGQPIKIDQSADEKEINPSKELSNASLDYTIHIDEVNLKKVLDKAEALAERIDRSSNEITIVIDDIINLFKLNRQTFTPSERLNKIDRNRDQTGESHGGLNLFEQRRARKLLKSPIRILRNKFGRGSTENMPANTTGLRKADNSIANLPEIKPLFKATDPTYPETTFDRDLGFENL